MPKSKRNEQSQLDTENISFLNEISDFAKTSIDDETPITRKSATSKVSSFRHYESFAYNGIQYSLGSCVYLENIEEPDRPEMMKIVQISTQSEIKKGKSVLTPVIRGRWIYGSHYRQNRFFIKEAFKMEDGEVLFGDEVDEIEVEQIIGTFQVLSKEEFSKPQYSAGNNTRSLRRGLKLQEILQKKIYYCCRAWRSRTKKLIESFSWNAYIENAKFDDAQVSKKKNLATPVKSKAVSSQSKNSSQKKVSRIPSVNSASKVMKKSSRRSLVPIKPFDDHDDDETAHEQILTSKRGRTIKKKLNACKEDSQDDNSADESFDESDLAEEDDAEELADAESDTSLSEEESCPVQNKPRKKIKPTRLRRSKKGERLEKFSILERRTKLLAAEDEFEDATVRLHVSAVPEKLPGREEEFCELYGLLEAAIEEGSGTCIYVSGVPGTGKTATVKGVLRDLQESVKNGQLADFEFIEINGMRLSEPAQAYSTLWYGLTGDRVSPAHAEDLLDARFKRRSADKVPCVVLMDELDLLVTKKQSVVYNFFEWPNLKNSQLIVIAIANTMDLPERSLSNKVASRLGLTRKVFQPYKHDQLIAIIQSRLEGLKCFDDNGVIYLARNIASSSGDARRCLDVCRRAVEIFMRSDDQQKVVQIAHVKQAILEMTKSSLVVSIERCSFQQLLFLLACVKRNRQCGIKELIFCDVIQEHIRYCREYSKNCPNVSEFHRISSFLGNYHLLIVESIKAGEPSQKLQLQVSEQDIFLAVKNCQDSTLLAIVEKLES